MVEVKEHFISCGMYAFTDELESAWRQLLNSFLELIDTGDDGEISFRFDSDQSLLCDPALFFAHTCGYPLMTRWKDSLTPFCLPVFDVPGTEGRLYSSQFIVASNSSIESLEECRGKVVAMNTADSNSGMNVFRYEIAKCNPAGQFFSRIIQTGGHLHSLEAVADGSADIAAIECVSYQLIQDHWPDLVERVRSIGFSVKTCGLPFVLPNTRVPDTDTKMLVDTLNQALALVPETVRERLHLIGFEPVKFDDYQGIVDLETFAIDSGYPNLI